LGNRLTSGVKVWPFAIAGYFLLLAVLITFPLISHLSGHLPYDKAHDQLYILSLLEFQTTALLFHPNEFFSGNIFYGSGDALYSSDLLLGLLAIFGPLKLLIGDSMVAFNLTYILAFAFNAIAMYWLGWTTTKSRSAALVAGTVYGFGALQINYAFHLQLIAAWWTPLALVFVCRFAYNLRVREFSVAVLAVWLQFATSVHLGLIAAMASLLFMIPVVYRQIVLAHNWRVGFYLFAVTVVMTIPFIPLVVGYLQYADMWQGGRTLQEVQFWSVEMRDYLSPTDRLRWHTSLADIFPMAYFERSVFLGFVPLIIGAFGFLVGIKSKIRVSGFSFRAISGVAGGLLLAGVLFSLGTHWKSADGLITDTKLPYFVLFEHVPVFRAIRVVARFSLMCHLAIAILVAVGVAMIPRNFRIGFMGTSIVGVVLAGVTVLEVLPTPLSVHAVTDHTQLVKELKQIDRGPAIFVPVRRTDVDWRYGLGGDVERMWIAAQGGVGPIVNGYSGHIWGKIDHFVAATEGRHIRDAGSLAESLQMYGIQYVLLDLSAISNQDKAMWDKFQNSSVVEKTLDQGGYRIITLAKSSIVNRGDWSSLDVRLLLDSAEPDQRFKAALVLSGREAGLPWVPPKGAYKRDLEILWYDLNNNVVSQSSGIWRPSSFLEPGQLDVLPLDIMTPSIIGNYFMVISIDREILLSSNVSIKNHDKKPFDGGVGLGGALVTRSPRSINVTAGHDFELHFDALNTGNVDWVGNANIRVGWQWYKRGQNGDLQPAGLPEGRLPLLNHVYGTVPVGAGHAFYGTATAPNKAGDYVLRVGLLAELVAWFPGDLLDVYVTVEPQ